MQTIRIEVKNITKNKIDGLANIKKKIESNPEEFEKYKNSAYFSLRTSCGTRMKINKRLLKMLEDHPQIIELNAKIKEHEDHIKMLQSKLSIDAAAYKLRLKELRELAKMENISELEKSVIMMTLKEHRTNFKKKQRETKKSLKEDVEEDTEAIKEIQKEKRKVISRVRKTMKKMVKEEKQARRGILKNEKKLRKTMRKQNAIKTDIKDENINAIVKKHEDALLEDIEDAKEEYEQEIQEKESKKAAKKAEKKAATLKAREEKKEAAAKAREEKKAEKKAATLKAREEKKAAAAKAREEKKAARKTKKNVK